MKLLDDVEVITDKYEQYGIKKGAIGTIIMAEIRNNTFDVSFCDEDWHKYAIRGIYVGDLRVVESSQMTDQDILQDLPLHDPGWWCKVEDGYILNLKGERKNKIPYDYES